MLAVFDDAAGDFALDGIGDVVLCAVSEYRPLENGANNLPGEDGAGRCLIWETLCWTSQCLTMLR